MNATFPPSSVCWHMISVSAPETAIPMAEHAVTTTVIILHISPSDRDTMPFVRVQHAHNSCVSSSSFFPPPLPSPSPPSPFTSTRRRCLPVACFSSPPFPFVGAAPCCPFFNDACRGPWPETLTRVEALSLCLELQRWHRSVC